MWARCFEDDTWHLYSVSAAGALVRAEAEDLVEVPLADLGALWRPACVVPLPVPGPLPQGPLRLVGAWEDIQVDPSAWRVDLIVPLLSYTVKHGTSRILQWQCRAAPGMVLGCGIRPKLWGEGEVMDPAQRTAVRSIAERQQQRYEQRAAAPGGSGVGRRRPREEDLLPCYHASWFDPSPPRVHVRQRVQQQLFSLTHQRQQQQQRHGQIQGPVVDDTEDPLEPPPIDGDPPWQAAWRRAWHRRLPRTSRLFAWRLLHGGLRCGGATVAFFPPGTPDLQLALCQAPCCRFTTPRPLDTLQHLFFRCPVGRSALRWLGALWEHLHPASAPVGLRLRILLADDLSTWQPPLRLVGLWTLLRVTMLKRIWMARSAVAAGEAPPTAFTVAAVLGAFVAEIRGLILQDWARVQGDVRQFSGVCPAWFRGRQPQLPLQRFKGLWCARGVLAAVQNEDPGPPRLVLRLTPASATVNGLVLG